MFNRAQTPKYCDMRLIHTRAHDAPLLNVPKYKKASSMKALAFKGSIEWNKLPTDVRNIVDKEKFKDIQRIALKKLVKNAGLG